MLAEVYNGIVTWLVKVRRLAERPQDQAEFDGFVNWLVWRCRPGRGYRVPLWASPTRRRQARRRWENTVRIFMGARTS